MCTKDQLSCILETVVEQVRALVGEKLDAVVLYGSYARGDYDAESDIDIMVRIRCPQDGLSDYEDALARICSRVSLQYDVTVSIVPVSNQTFERFRTALPFYANTEKEGVRIA